MDKKYNTQRYLPEKNITHRNEFLRDKARLIHSAYFRQMGNKTQVLTKWQKDKSPYNDFVRSRLTHSLEVAQIGYEIALKLHLDPIKVETACLAHDIGHPPFGHNGESILNKIASDIDGFEGNAQTFRILTRLSNKRFINNKSVGLNLTRGVLNSVLKYPHTRIESKNNKFSVYLPDTTIFNWVREYNNNSKPVIEAQIMDFADDVAYSVNDIEDTIFKNSNNLYLIENNIAKIIKVAQNFFIKQNEINLNDAIKRLVNLPFWISKIPDNTKNSFANIKNMTSELIERFVSDVQINNNKLIVPNYIFEEIAILKSFSHIYFINTPPQLELKNTQDKIINKVYKKFAKNPQNMQNEFYDEYTKANNTMLKKRIIIDQIASLTDESIMLI